MHDYNPAYNAIVGAAINATPFVWTIQCEEAKERLISQLTSLFREPIIRAQEEIRKRKIQQSISPTKKYIISNENRLIPLKKRRVQEETIP